MSTISRVLCALSLASVAAVASACAGSAAGQTAGSGTGHGSGLVLNAGDQQQELQTLFQASGAMSGARYKVNFVEFDCGPLVDAGFAAHRIDVGFMGDLPASLAVKSGLPVAAVAVDLPIGAWEFLLAKPGISSIAQLRGKPVAYTTGTAEQAFALRALKTAGLNQHDVQQVNVSLLQLGTVLRVGIGRRVGGQRRAEGRTTSRPTRGRRCWPPSTASNRPATPTCSGPPPRSATRPS